MSKFQIILLVIFGVFILIAVAVFSLYRGGGSSSATVVVWGDIPSYDFEAFLTNAGLNQDNSLVIKYVAKSPEVLESDFTEALARNVGPDLIILTQDKIWKEKDKLLPIPYKSVSERDFKDTFVEEGELFLTPEGVYALPLSLDPMVLYYNRDILSTAKIANPISYWDEIYDAASSLSQKDPAGNILRSAIALGEASNIPNFKSIISLLMLQAGTPITTLTANGLKPELTSRYDFPVIPGESALDFYTQFSNPTRVYYSWNRSLVDAQTHFTSGDSAYYLGFASELRVLRNKNPTLNFGVALVPQSRVSNRSITFGKLRGIAISRGTTQAGPALDAVVRLVSNNSSLALSSVLVLPSPRRDILSVRPDDAIFSVFYDAGLQSKGFLDPDINVTKSIFREMIESVTSGRARTTQAVTKAQSEFEKLIK